MGTRRRTAKVNYLLTELERRSLTAEAERRVKVASPLAPRWLRRSIAERVVQRLSLALAEGRADSVRRFLTSQLTQGQPPQDPAMQELALDPAVALAPNPNPPNNLTT